MLVFNFWRLTVNCIEQGSFTNCADLNKTTDMAWEQSPIALISISYDEGGIKL